MKTITIRNLALAQRSVQLVIRLIPYVKKHFEGCLRKTEGTQAESKQIETFRKQFDQVSHLKSPKIILTHLMSSKVAYTQCGNFMVFLSLRFYVKSNLENLEILKQPILPF